MGMGYGVTVRMHMSLDDRAAALQRALDDERRWHAIAGAVGAIEEGGHDWEADPAAWVRDQRRADPGRAG